MSSNSSVCLQSGLRVISDLRMGIKYSVPGNRLRNAGLIMIDGVGPCELSVIVFVSDSQVTVADLVQRFLCDNCPDR